MQEQQTTKEEKKTPDPKGFRDKMTEALAKDDDLLSRLLKSLTNPLVLVVAIPLIIFLLWRSEKEEQSKTGKLNGVSSEEKLRRKNKKLKKRLKKASLTVNGKTTAALL